MLTILELLNKYSTKNYCKLQKIPRIPTISYDFPLFLSISEKQELSEASMKDHKRVRSFLDSFVSLYFSSNFPAELQWQFFILSSHCFVNRCSIASSKRDQNCLFNFINKINWKLSMYSLVQKDQVFVISHLENDYFSWNMIFYGSETVGKKFVVII